MAVKAQFLTRRQLFATGALAAAGGAAAVTLRLLWPLDAEPSPVTRVAADDVPGPDDDPYPISIDGGKAYVVAVTTTDFIALLRKCTNEGCTVAWVPHRGSGLGRTFERIFRCPCCGSEYGRYGGNIWGPATWPLRLLDIEQHSDGDVFVSMPKITDLQRLTVSH